MTTHTTFEHEGMTWTIYHVHNNVYRIIDTIGYWFLINADDEESAMSIAKVKIENLYKINGGAPNTNPRIFDSYTVLKDWTFRVGTHSRNYSGTGTYTMLKGTTLIFDQEGDEHGFYYDMFDTERKTRLQGPRPWGMLYDEIMVNLYQDPSFKAFKERMRKK